MKEVVKWGSGGTPKATEISYYKDGTIPWLIIGDLNNGIVNTSSKKITELGLSHSSAKLIPPGTLLVAMYGSIGKLGITGIECCTNQAIAYAKELHGVTTYYMFYYMAMIKLKLVSMGKGGTQSNISQTVLNSVDVIVPPIQVQESIVTRIDEMFSELDKVEETLQITKQQLAIYRQAVLKDAFAGIERTTTMGTVAEMIDPQPSHRTPPELVNGVPYIGIGDIDYLSKKIILSSARKVAPSVLDEHRMRYTLKEDDFIMGKIGTIGKPFKVDLPQNYTLSANVILIQPNKSKVNPGFLFWQFSSSFITQQLSKGANATSQPAFGIKKARLLKIKICSIFEQQKIAVELDKEMSMCDNIELTINTSLLQATILRQSILKQAFEGGL